MLGAIAGDIFGAAYEWNPSKAEDFELFAKRRFFTDDTVLTIATADALVGDGDFATAYHRWGRSYPEAGYGARFRHWLSSEQPQPYESFGNGSAMRVSPIGWFYNDLDTVLAAAAQSAKVSHNHEEGIKGAQATAAAIFLARTGANKATICSEIESRFAYNLHRTISEIRPSYSFDVTCQGSVPEALIAFLEAKDFEHSIRLAISLGGDADTQAAIAGSVAEAFWGGVSSRVEAEVRQVLDEPMFEVVDAFMNR